MRVPLSWLQDYVDLPEGVSAEMLAERLTEAGLEVGSIEYIGVPQGTPPANMVMPPSDHLVWDRDKIVLGYIHEVKPHPDADRLVLAMVDHGTGEIEQIVTGAPNLFPYKGRGVLNPPIPCPIAREGAEVYDGHADEPGKRMILKERKIRGIPNRHMVCSELELGISDEHEGVLLLEYEDYRDIPSGTPLQDVLGDVILDVELTPNLARCFSILGVAREVAALYNQPLREPDYTLPNMDSDEVKQYISIDIREPELNPRFTAAMVKNIEIKTSPAWMQRRLKAIGQRPINNIVDVSNYVMFEIGQPTHAFDYDILAERAGDKKPVIITRLPEKGERLTTLDGQEHILMPHNLLVADEAGALSFAGIMGGRESEVQDPADTVLDAVGVEINDDDEKPVHGKASARPRGTETVLFEAATWNFIGIRKTLSSTKIHSEAAARFSRGVHPAMALRGLVRGLKLMAEVSGGTIVPGIIDEYPRPAEKVVVELPVSEVKRILGFEIPQAEIVRILRGLQFEVVESSTVLIVTIPDHRLDIGEGVIGQADLIEDIARIYGYNNIPNTQISDALPKQRRNLKLELEERTRDILVEAGLREVISYRLTTPEREALLTPQGQKSSWGGDGYITLANPIASDKIVMRHTLMAGLLEAAEKNSYHHKRQAIFELGQVYYPNKENVLPDEITRLGILMMGERSLENWQSSSTGKYDFYDLKGIIETLTDGLHVPDVSYAPTSHNSFYPGRTASLVVDGHEVGVFGEIHPVVREAYGLGMDLSVPVLAAEIDLGALLSHAQDSHKVRAIPTQPAVYQDISFMVDRTTSAAAIEDVIRKAGGDLLVEVRLFDIYTGEQIPADKKSMAYALTYQHPEETLTDKQVAKLHEKIVKAVEHQLGAKLRA
jgi:phenylalanyl-tRNA synthetase beta chain